MLVSRVTVGTAVTTEVGRVVRSIASSSHISSGTRAPQPRLPANSTFAGRISVVCTCLSTGTSASRCDFSVLSTVNWWTWLLPRKKRSPVEGTAMIRASDGGRGFDEDAIIRYLEEGTMRTTLIRADRPFDVSVLPSMSDR